MVEQRPLLLFLVLFFYSVSVITANVGKSQIVEDLKESNYRTDAEQDPLTSVTLATQTGDTQSTLFSTCLATSRTLEAKFASIEIVPGSEYVRYVPGSLQLKFPVNWMRLAGNYPNIFDCAKAAHDAGWPMFKYDGLKCEVVNATYILNDVSGCEENDSDAVFILSTAHFDCPWPKFFVGIFYGSPICGFVNEDLMTYQEAKHFCENLFPNHEFDIFILKVPNLTFQAYVSAITGNGYTKTNLWMGREEDTAASVWNVYFPAEDFADGISPPFNISLAPRACYMDKNSNFKLRVSDMSFKAGVFCVTTPTEGRAVRMSL